MDRRITATIDADPDRIIETLADLTTYPNWLDLVAAVEPDGDQAWLVTLRARLGPLARSKRLRMVRAHLDDTSVRFERVEVDMRDHAEWTLSADVTEGTVQVHLHYSGDLWTAPVERALVGYERRAAAALTEYLSP